MKKRGFTLVELLVVLFIVGIISSIGIVYFVRHRNNQIALKTAETLAESLYKQIARAEALNSHKISGEDTACGITFSGGTFSFFERPNNSDIVTSTVNPSTLFGCQTVTFRVVPNGTHSNSRIYFYADKTSLDNWNGSISVQYNGSTIRTVTVSLGGRVEVQ